MKDETQAIKNLHTNPRYKKLVKFLKSKIQKDPKNHWLIGQLASTYFELKKYKKAYLTLGIALNEKDNCPLLWWQLACTLEALERIEDGITVWKQIIQKGIKPINYTKHPCWESKAFKNGIVVDSFYRIGIANLTLSRKRKAKKYFNKFFDWHNNPNIPIQESVYPLKRVTKEYYLHFKK